MIKSFIINNYLSREFLKTVLVMTFVFFCFGFIINLFEEINLFKDYEVGIGLPIILSLLFVPNLVYNMFPFLILLSGIWFFLKIKRTDEIIPLCHSLPISYVKIDFNPDLKNSCVKIQSEASFHQ